MNKSILILLPLIFLTLNSFVPNNKIANVTWGAPIKVPAGKFIKTYDFGEGRLVHIWKDGLELNTLVTDDKLNEKARGNVEIEHMARRGKYYYEKIFRLGDEIYVLSKIKDKKVEKFFYYVQRIDPENTSKISQPILISQMTFLKSARKEVEDIQVSPDYTRLYVGHNNATADRSEFWYELKILDTELEEVYTDRVELESSEALNVVDFKFNKNGDAAVIARRSDSKDAREKGKPFVYYTAAVLRNEELFRYRLDLDEHHIADIQVTFAPDNGLILSGFYSSRSEFYVNGIFMVREDIDHEELDEIKYHEFTTEEITRFQSERKEKKASKKEDKGKEIQFYNYDIRNIEATSEGVYIIAEQFYVKQSSSSSNAMNRSPTGHMTSSSSSKTTYTFNFMDVMVAKLNFDSELEWISRVPKHNEIKTSTSGGFASPTSNPFSFNNNSGTVSPYLLQYWKRTGYIEKACPYSSYNYTIKDDQIYLLYNDHLKNHTEYNPRKIIKSKKGGDQAVTCLAKINSEGLLSRSVLYNVKEEATFTQVRRCVPLDEEAGFIILGQKKKTIKLGKCAAIE